VIGGRQAGATNGGNARGAMARGAIEVKAELKTRDAKIQLVRYQFFGPPDSVLRGGRNIRLELCLGSRHRSARGCFREQWKPSRFEPIGDLFAVPPDQVLMARSDEDRPLNAIVCELDESRVLELMSEVPEVTDQRLTASLDIRDTKVRNLLLRLAEEARQPGFASEALASHIIGQLSIELVRIGAKFADTPARAGLASWQLRLIDQRLKEVREAPSLEDLATLCRISVRQLTRGFRSSRGCSIGTYAANCRIEHARRLLAGDESVTAVASALGFSSCSNFCFAFRRATGIAPGEYRRMALRG
jgi:AraC family transcriptional regulator